MQVSPLLSQPLEKIQEEEPHSAGKKRNKKKQKQESEIMQQMGGQSSRGKKAQEPVMSDFEIAKAL